MNILKSVLQLFTPKAQAIDMPLNEPIRPITPLNPIKTYKELNKWGLLPIVQYKCGQFIDDCKAQGYNVFVTQGLRTKAQQDALYAQGRTKTGKIVTNAPYPKSLHNHGLAFDIAFNGKELYPADDKIWKAVADIGKKYGLEAGYYWKKFQDKPHFQFTGKYTEKQIIAGQYNKADFNA